jgi:hypothetical protein
MINGGGTMTGFAAAQIALLRGARATIPIARGFTWGDWRNAVQISVVGRARGKFLPTIDGETAGTV